MAIKNDYQAGTVSVAASGTVVTGVGTLWLAATIQAGDTFKVKNLDAVIASVESNTSLTLAEPWTGGALTASAYRIRFQPDGSRFTAALRDLVSAISGGSVAALQALTGAADKLPYFTGAGTMALANFNTWARGFIGAVDTDAARELLGAGKKGSPIVIVGTGQSNFARESALTGSWVVPENLKVWNNTVGTPGTAWVTPSTANMNVLWRFAAEIALANPDREVRLVRQALGGIPISYWMLPPQSTDMYAATVNAVNAALSNLGLTTIDIFMWWQGENNVADQSTYEADFETVVTRFKGNSWFKATTPIGVFGLSNSTVAGNAQHGLMNNTLQRVVNADPDNRMFFYSASAPASLWADTFHATGDGYDYIGRMAAHNFLYGTHRANAGIIINPETRDAIFQQDKAGNTRFEVRNASTDAAARSSLAITGTGGSWTFTAGSGTLAAAGYGGVGGFYLDNPTFQGYRINLVEIARIDSFGLKVGTTVNTPHASNAVGTVITRDSGILLSASAAGALFVNRMTNDGAVAGFLRQGSVVGNISVTASGTSYNITSDYRLKTNIEPLSAGAAGDFIDRLKPKVFVKAGVLQAGFIAHEFGEVTPLSVTGEKDAVEEVGTAVRKKTIIKGELLPADPDNGIFYEMQLADQVIPADEIKGITKREAPNGYTWKKTGTRPIYQAIQASTSEVMANIVAELQSLRRRVKELEAE